MHTKAWEKGSFSRDRVAPMTHRLIWTGKGKDSQKAKRSTAGMITNLKVPKREIFDRSDFPDFYTIKSS